MRHTIPTIMPGLAVTLALAGCASQPQTVVVTQPAPPVLVQQPPPMAMAPPVAASGSPGVLPPSVAGMFPTPNPQGGGPGQPPTQQEFALLGETVQPSTGTPGCGVDLVLNRDQFLASLPRLQSLGIINAAVTPQQAQAQILSVALAFTLQAAPIAAHEFLNEGNAPFACHFRQAISVPAAAGGTQLMPMFEFDMDHQTDSQAPWLRLLTAGFTYTDANRFIAAAPNFHLAPGVQAQVAHENGG